MIGLNWWWIAVMVVVPPLLAPPVAYVIWRRGEMILGNLAGSAVILGTALGLILRESAEIDRVMRACIDAGYSCPPEPSAIVRHAVYAGIGFLEVAALFMASLRFERRQRDRRYAPEWR
jgi:ABC-type dipeptide/oligopeptide/nickel transport system permease subunit